jgi:NAD(P)-dependent dehydrogenase (short-subunit alcohol dehydrogenase family)
MRLAGKVAIITGAAGGMGEASALIFAREGARIATGAVFDNDAGWTAMSGISVQAFAT